MFCGSAHAEPATPLSVVAEQVGLDQRLGEQIPLDLWFFDESGQRVRLQQYFGKQPVVLMLVYYQCPMLCTQVLNGFLKSSQAVPLQIGKDYQVLTISFDPREDHELAATKKASYVRAYRRPGADVGWHFLTGEKDQIEQLARAVGFRYRFDPRSQQYAHASGLMLATPEGKLSRYFYDINYHPRDLRLGLVESSANKIGSPIEQILLMCYHYDPATGKYGLMVENVLRVGCIATALCLGGGIVLMIRRERRKNRAEQRHWGRHQSPAHSAGGPP